MRIFIILMVILLGLLIISQVMIKLSTRAVETHGYEVIRDFKQFEIRRYEPAVFSYVEMKKDNYRSNASMGFRPLASYIFGANDKKQSIAMTSPVTMTMEDSVVMKFMVPKDMRLDELPQPTNPSVKLRTEQGRTVAAIRFGGFANNKRIKAKSEALKELLRSNNISYKGPISVLGYNPPFEWVGRRNEVIIEVEY